MPNIASNIYTTIIIIHYYLSSVKCRTSLLGKMKNIRWKCTLLNVNDTAFLMSEIITTTLVEWKENVRFYLLFLKSLTKKFKYRVTENSNPKSLIADINTLSLDRIKKNVRIWLGKRKYALIPILHHCSKLRLCSIIYYNVHLP